MEKCLPESIKENIRYKQSIEDVWRYFMRSDTFPHDLMLSVNTAKAVLQQDWRALEAHLDLLLKQMYRKWLAKTRWWWRQPGYCRWSSYKPY
jgi:hypothetical protein